MSQRSTTCEGVCRQDFEDELVVEELPPADLRVDLRGVGVTGGGVLSAETPSGWLRVETMMLGLESLEEAFLYMKVVT